MEYKGNGIPVEDLVILLQVSPKITKGLMEGRKLDIHEKDLAYQEEVFRLYKLIAKQKKNWEVVDCAFGEKVLPISNVHDKVLTLLKRRKII